MSFRLKGQGNSARKKDIEEQQPNDGGGSVETIKDDKDNPTEKFLQKWNVIFLLSCLIAVSLDPLFFYLPMINEDKKCLALHKKLWTTTIASRSVIDIIKLSHIILQFCTGFIDEKLQNIGKIGKNKWNKNPCDIARRRSYFVVDILAILPIPQVLISSIFSEMSSTKSSNKIFLMYFVVLFQYVPRFLQIYQSWKELMRSDKKIEKNIWFKAALNFFLYLLAGHVLGAFWYFFSTQRVTDCWHISCENHNGCVGGSFNCDHTSGDHSFLNDFCTINTPNTTLFDFGIFLQALQSGVVDQSTNFLQKIFNCFWWGMQNLSSFGQNLRTSNNPWENFFALCISTSGLLLFLYFIGNLQFYMLLKTTRSEELRLRKNSKKRTKQKEEIDIWCSKHAGEFKSLIIDDMTKRFEEDEDVYLENLLPNLPGELQKKVKQHICLKLLKDVKELRDLNEHILVRICHTLKPVFYNEHNFIVREGDPIDAIFFITEGIAWTYTTSNKDEVTVPTHAKRLVEGQFFGGELGEYIVEWVRKSTKASSVEGQFFGGELGEYIVEWVRKSTQAPRNNLSKLPVSSKNLKTHTKVEAFALMANDLVNILSTYKLWELDPKQLDSAAASIVQRAWRRNHQGSASRDPHNPAASILQ